MCGRKPSCLYVYKKAVLRLMCYKLFIQLYVGMTICHGDTDRLSYLILTNCHKYST